MDSVGILMNVTPILALVDSVTTYLELLSASVSQDMLWTRRQTNVKILMSAWWRMEGVTTFVSIYPALYCAGNLYYNLDSSS